jgi:hypothetical protein
LSLISKTSKIAESQSEQGVKPSIYPAFILATLLIKVYFNSLEKVKACRRKVLKIFAVRGKMLHWQIGGKNHV